MKLAILQQLKLIMIKEKTNKITNVDNRKHTRKILPGNPINLIELFVFFSPFFLFLFFKIVLHKLVVLFVLVNHWFLNYFSKFFYEDQFFLLFVKHSKILKTEYLICNVFIVFV